MSDQTQIKILKKRGRKPKNKSTEPIILKEETPDSEKEVIITYLPININDIDVQSENDEKDNDIFIKSESYFSDTNTPKQTKLEEIKKSTYQISGSSESEYKSTSINNNFNKINVYNIEFNENTKCWWCKHRFTTPRLSLPEQHHNDTFFCTGNYCSWECMKAYNIDTNDITIWKRESLINLMHYLTYGIFKEIKPASSWLTLKDFGGNLTILEFRKNFELVGSDFLVLHPPLISRQMQIEESYKKAPVSGVIVNKLDKLLFESTNNLTLRRNKPIETSQINLEKSMGLKRFMK
jgi:hypothetical protein